MKNCPLELLDEELKPLQIFPAANQSELKFLISAFRWILLLCREIIELLLHLVNLSLQVRHLVFSRIKMNATMTNVQRTQIFHQSGKKAKKEEQKCHLQGEVTLVAWPVTVLVQRVPDQIFDNLCHFVWGPRANFANDNGTSPYQTGSKGGQHKRIMIRITGAS